MKNLSEILKNSCNEYCKILDFTGEKTAKEIYKMILKGDFNHLGLTEFYSEHPELHRYKSERKSFFWGVGQSFKFYYLECEIEKIKPISFSCKEVKSNKQIEELKPFLLSKNDFSTKEALKFIQVRDGYAAASDGRICLSIPTNLNDGFYDSNSEKINVNFENYDILQTMYLKEKKINSKKLNFDIDFLKTVAKVKQKKNEIKLFLFCGQYFQIKYAKRLYEAAKKNDFDFYTSGPFLIGISSNGARLILVNFDINKTIENITAIYEENKVVYYQ